MEKVRLKIRILCLVSLITSVSAFAQGDGPRSFILLPKDVWAVNVQWLGMEQNINLNGNAHIP